MPQQRVLQEIDANPRIRKELKPILRAQIVGAAVCGVGIRETARRLKIPPATVQTTLRRDTQRQDHQSSPRTGAPHKTSARERATIIAYVRANPKHTYAQIRENVAPTLSSKTISRIVKSVGIGKWICKRRPYLSEQVVKKRYDWVQMRRDWSEEEWSTVIFSDESSIERGQGGSRQWAFRTPQQKWHPKMIQTYKKSRDISIMVWGAIWIGGRSDLKIMKRADDGRGGYTAESYIDILEQTMETCWQPDMIFMQDNAPIHTAQKIKDWFENRGIPLLPWPPYSPDLNPIEHIWARMKEWIQKHYPELSEMGHTQEALNELARVIVEAWEAIPQEDIDHLIKGMDYRVNAVRAAQGWHTKY
jgi:transposase